MLAFAAMIATVSAWGPEGHSAVGFVAQTMLNPRAAAKLNTILDGQSLADVANWPDQMRNNSAYNWAAPLHYIDTPDWACNFDYTRDCKDDFCVAGAIFNYTKRLQRNDPLADESAKFLVHFVGDIHQPLHVGFTSDLGGNLILCNFFNTSTELHVVWDVSIIERRIALDFNNDLTRWFQYLATKAVAERIKLLHPRNNNKKTNNPLKTDATQWAAESISLACSYAYVNADGVTHLQSGVNLDQSYYERALPLIERQVVHAGMRLAMLLNTIFP